MRARFLACLLLVSAPPAAFADPAANPVIHWASVVQQAIHNAGAPRSAGTSQVLHTMAHLAVYDAVVAIEGGYEPYAARIRAWHGADLRAAVATAAYLTVRGRVAASQLEYLDQAYAGYLSAIPGSIAKADGIRVGAKAAATMVRLRKRDGYSNVLLYQCSAIPPPPGEFEPDAGCPTAPGSPQPVDVKVGQIEPFTFKHTRPFRPNGPVRMSSARYTADFIEARDYGRVDSAVRTPEQTDIAYFWSENPYVHWNRNLVGLAIDKGLNVLETARMFALVHTAVSDALIVGFEAKYRHAAWRPRTAIPQADADGNPRTDADPTWRPLLMVNHPEYPSGHGFWTTALVDALISFFGTNQLTWTIVTSKAAVPRVEQTERTYHDLTALKAEVFDARVWGGLHWRYSTLHGAKIGREVAAHVSKRFFRPRK